MLNINITALSLCAVTQSCYGWGHCRLDLRGSAIILMALSSSLYAKQTGKYKMSHLFCADDCFQQRLTVHSLELSHRIIAAFFPSSISEQENKYFFTITINNYCMGHLSFCCVAESFVFNLNLFTLLPVVTVWAAVFLLTLCSSCSLVISVWRW